MALAPVNSWEHNRSVETTPSHEHQRVLPNIENLLSQISEEQLSFSALTGISQFRCEGQSGTALLRETNQRILYWADRVTPLNSYVRKKS
jgi:hypothetical protein